jgi:hypothetical protein
MASWSALRLELAPQYAPMLLICTAGAVGPLMQQRLTAAMAESAMSQAVCR